MTENPKKTHKKRSEVRFEREAKALQKNLEKRKKQQQAREELKKSDGK